MKLQNVSKSFDGKAVLQDVSIEIKQGEIVLVSGVSGRGKTTLLRRLLYIHLPQLKPFIMSACATALGMAWKAGVAAEIIGTPDGSIGKQLFYSKIYLDTDDLLCWTVIIVIVSVLFEKLFMLGLKALYGRLERG